MVVNWVWDCIKLKHIFKILIFISASIIKFYCKQSFYISLISGSLN